MPAPFPSPALLDEAPISSFITFINDNSALALSGVTGKFITYLAPFGAAVFGIYVILTMWSYMRGSNDDPVQDFLLKMLTWSVVLGYGFNAANYTTHIMPIVTGLGNDIAANVFGGGSGVSGMDVLMLALTKIMGDGWHGADVITDGSLSPALSLSVYVLLIIKITILILGVIPFVVAGVITVVVANIGSQIISAVAPLFFLALLFPATRQYFSSWLNSAISYMLVPVFTSVVFLLGTNIILQILNLPPNSVPKDSFWTAQKFLNDQTLVTAPFARVILASVSCYVFLFLLKQVSSLASSLSSGGINAGMPSGGLGSIAKGIKGSVAGTSKERDGIRTANKERLAKRHAAQNKKNGVEEAPKAG